MFYTNVEKVIPEKNIVCVSPHYDDFLFFLGSWTLGMKNKNLLGSKCITNINTFSRSNYQERDAIGNRDQSLKRVQYATGIRVIEDLECLDALMGAHCYKYRLMGEEESQVRGKILNEGEGEMEMAFGSYETMDDCDREILGRMTAAIRELAQQKDTAIVLPLSMKGHIDHFIVREAGVAVMTNESCAAAFYFAEDKPYAGLMNEWETGVNSEFIAGCNLERRAFRHYPADILRLAYEYYPSQIDKVYDEGIYARNEQLKKIYGLAEDVDCIYRFNK